MQYNGRYGKNDYNSSVTLVTEPTSTDSLTGPHACCAGLCVKVNFTSLHSGGVTLHMDPGTSRFSHASSPEPVSEYGEENTNILSGSSGFWSSS
jgi:hypothetical protein